MASELDRELAALRNEQAQAQADQNKAVADALALVTEFSRSMSDRRIPTLPVYMVDVAVTPGQKKALLQKERPRVWHTTYRTVAEGWPVGRYDSDSSAPRGYLNTPVVTTHGRLVSATWGVCFPEPSRGTNYNKGPDYGVPALHTTQPDSRMLPMGHGDGRLAYLYVNTEDELQAHRAPQFAVSARLLAEAMQHYLR
ncbi:hypothetical protein [Mycolicibacterium tusciae]|uniref:hypothetical protein n=1 Tax=Mycolicibacterium tusciae TaxID=75922 RepID=UPI00024A47E9|nr:hypothetical protein [Mycolicibacterium tusciae]